MGLMCLKNASVADGISQVSSYGFESHGKEPGMDFKYSGRLLEAFLAGEWCAVKYFLKDHSSCCVENES